MGKGFSTILGVTLLAAVWLLWHPVEERQSTLEFWVFARTHFLAYQDTIEEFEAAHPGVSVDLQLVDHRAITNRLQSAYWAGIGIPDLVEISIDNAGVFFRGPADQVGFADLGPWLASSGQLERLVPARVAPYTDRGRVYGIPHDVHPVMLAYRRDVFESEGVDIASVATWDAFVRLAKRMTIPNERYMLELSDNTSAQFSIFLYQQGGGYFDASGALTMNSPLVLDTLLWYIPLISGPERIGAALEGGGGIGMGQMFTQALENDYVLCFLCPDWRVEFFETDAPRMRGKMALTPLPAFTPGGRRVSTFGGTMLGLTKECGNPEVARALAKALYLDEQRVAAGFDQLGILPALKDAWDMAAYHQTRPYWSNQNVGGAFIEVAQHVPPEYTSAYLSTAKITMGSVIASCVSHYTRMGEEGFEAFAANRLREAAQEVRRAMRRDPFREHAP